MHHSFDISIAQKFGVNEAIFLNNLSFWIQKNQANNKHFHEGRYWTYNSQEAFAQLFPYWSRQNIRTILLSLQKHDLLIQDNFNEIGYDRTTWYTLTDLGLSLFPCLNNDQNAIGWNQPMERLESTNGKVGINQPIPDIKPDIKPDKNKERGKKRHVPRPPTEVSLYFEPIDSHELLAAKLHVDVNKEKDAFIDYYQAHGKRMVNWNAAFNNWLRKASEFDRKSGKKEHSITTTIKELKESSSDFRQFLLS